MPAALPANGRVCMMRRAGSTSRRSAAHRRTPRRRSRSIIAATTRKRRRRSAIANTTRFTASSPISKQSSRSSPRLIRRRRRVGGAPLKAFAQVTHRAPMLSLDNTYSEDEVADFYKRLERLLPDETDPGRDRAESRRRRRFAPLRERRRCDTPRHAATGRSATTSRKTSARSGPCRRG